MILAGDIGGTKTLLVSTESEQLMVKQNKVAVISAMAMEGKDELCVRRCKYFAGVMALNQALALKTLSYGGVVLAGGIAAKNLSLMKRGEFMQGFLDKGRYRKVLQSMSVKVCVNHEAALIGAAKFAKRLNDAYRSS